MHRAYALVRFFDEHLACVHRNGASRHGVVDVAERHSYRTRQVVVDDNRVRAVVHCGLHFVRKSRVAALDESNRSVVTGFVLKFSSDFRGVVRRSAHAAYDDVLEVERIAFTLACDVVKSFDKIVFVAVCVRRFGDKRNLIFIVVCLNEGRLLSVDGRNRKRRTVSGRRADRTAVGVACKVRTVAAAEARGIVVARSNHKADACRSHSVVNFVDEFVALFIGETRARTKTHVDDVHAEFNTIADRRDDVDGVRTAQRIAIEVVGENFAYNKLRFGSDAHESLVRFFVHDVIGFTCDDTCNVRAVRRIGRINIRVVVRIVVCERHFGVVVHLVNGGLSVESRACSHLCRNIFFRPSRVGRHCRKRLVRIIKTGVEHGNHHTFALVREVGRIVNTRRIDVCVIAHGNSRNRIGFRIINTLYTVELFNLVECVCIDFQSNAVVERRV